MKPDIYPELKKIESEIKVLKVLIIKSKQIPTQKASLGGLLKGKTISEEDVEKIKKSLFKA